MPKTKVRPTTDDLPFWDALVAELGDPRPYEPTVIDVVTQPDDSLVDDVGFDDAFSALDDDVRDATIALDYAEAYALATHYVTEDALRNKLKLTPRRHPAPVVIEPDPTLQEMLDRTVVLPLLGDATLQVVRPRKEEPRWPS
jgi:hypothetical protein